MLLHTYLHTYSKPTHTHTHSYTIVFCLTKMISCCIDIFITWIIHSTMYHGSSSMRIYTNYRSFKINVMKQYGCIVTYLLSFLKLLLYICSLFSLVLVLGFELRALSFLGRCSTTWVTRQAPFALIIFQVGSGKDSIPTTDVFWWQA
jgi:hypothetical protein